MMMRIIKRYADMEATTIAHLVLNADHYRLLETRVQIENLAEARMLLEVYEGCDICFEPDCTSDHK